MHRGIAWDDLRFILAVAEHGSLARAARALGVHHTTVLRRIDSFEAAHGLRLFERLPTGYVLTPGGEELLAAARTMAGMVTALERRLAGQDLRLAGELRVTTTDTLMGSILPEMLAAFHAAHPGVKVEVSVTNLMANLTRRDADVAIRPASDPPAMLVGRRVAGVAFALYASPAYLATVPRAAAGELGVHRWLAPDDTLAASTVARWMRAALPADAEVVLRADSLLSLRQAALAGLGVTALPCYLGDITPGLARVRAEPIEAMATALWVLTHEDLRRTARVSAFTSFLAEALARKRSLLEGAAPA
jgi:DNA-binding transcriptional LysR family regulator